MPSRAPHTKPATLIKESVPGKAQATAAHPMGSN